MLYLEGFVAHRVVQNNCNPTCFVLVKIHRKFAYPKDHSERNDESHTKDTTDVVRLTRKRMRLVIKLQSSTLLKVCWLACTIHQFKFWFENSDSNADLRGPSWLFKTLPCKAVCEPYKPFTRLLTFCICYACRRHQRASEEVLGLMNKASICNLWHALPEQAVDSMPFRDPIPACRALRNQIS